MPFMDELPKRETPKYQSFSDKPMIDDQLQVNNPTYEQYDNPDLVPLTYEKKKPEEAPSLMGAAFRQENLIASYAVDALRPKFKPQEGHNPLDIIQGTIYEDEFLDNFVGSQSEDETRYIMGKIGRELKDRERIANGGVWGVGAGILAGTLDPTMLLPFGAPVKAYKGLRLGVNVGKTMARTAALGGAATAIQETGLQLTQETRTGLESALSVGTGTILGGVLGGAMGQLGKKEVARLTAKLDAFRAGQRYDEGSVGAVAAGASAGAARAIERGTGEIVGGAAVRKSGLAKTSPVLRLQTSEFDEARDTVRDMADGGVKLSENAQGIATSQGGTVETRVKLWQGGLARALRLTDDAYSRYWYGQAKMFGRIRSRVSSEFSRVTGRLGNRLTAREFRREVGRAMSRGDRHAIPEVAEAARFHRQNVFDPLKQAAIRVGYLSEDVKAPGAESYITRVYNRDMIVGRRNEFHDILYSHIRAHSDSANLEDIEVHDIVDGVIEQILGGAPFRMPGVDIVAKAGPLQERTLKIADEKIEDFLERDIEEISRYYTRTMASNVELAQKFGDIQMTEPLRKLSDEWTRRSKAVDALDISTKKKQNERARLKKEFDQAQRDILALRDRILGTYALPDNPNGLGHRAAKIAGQLNYLRLLGGMTLSAIPDLFRPAMTYGLTRTFAKGWLPMVRSFKTFRLAAAEVKKAGTALDMVLDTRTRAMADLFEDWQRGSALERGLDKATSQFGVTSLMAPWNAVMKQITGTVVMDSILRSAEKIARGTARQRTSFLRKGDVELLAAAGIDENMARRIWAQFEGGGGAKQKGLYLPNTEDWTDRAAMEAFRAALVREVDRTIVTPGLEKPLFMSTGWGRLLGQFKSFAFSSVTRTLVAGLQERDAAFVNGAILSLALGGVSAWAKMQAAGVDTSNWSASKWATESVDRSGLLTIFSDVNNIVEKASRGRLGMSMFTGEMASRYQSRNVASSFIGPTYGLAEDALTLTGSLSAGDWAGSDTRKMRQLLPYQNLFYLRLLLDEVEKGFNEATGIPQRKKH